MSLEGVRETKKGPVDVEIVFHGTIPRFDFFEEVEKGLGVISGVDEVHVKRCTRRVGNVWRSIFSIGGGGVCGVIKSFWAFEELEDGFVFRGSFGLIRRGV